jgi:Icc-related predicted phosphoesterase
MGSDTPMRVLAVGDVHSPRFLEPFLGGLDHLEPPDLFLLAGDMINRGRVYEFRTLLDAIHTKLGSDFPVIACFGNEEYAEVRKEITSIAGKEVIFLDEASTEVQVGDLRVGIVGTQGSLDKPTNWQKEHLPSIKGSFERRAHRAKSLLRKMRHRVDKRVLLMHYSPCLETCEGEDARLFAWLGSRKFYNLVLSEQPDLVIHGHVHNATLHQARIGETVVMNVALPAVGNVTELNIWTPHLTCVQ